MGVAAHGEPEVAPGPLTGEQDLERYVSPRRDLFRIDEHLDNWLYAQAPYRITFVRYKNLWDNADRVAWHMELERLDLRDRIVRSSDQQSLASETRDEMQCLYGNLAARTDALPDVFYAENGRLHDPAGPPITLTAI